jgi:hypothetical protein
LYAWHGDVVALIGNAAVLSGAMVLCAGVDAARVRMRILNPVPSHGAIRWETGLATDAGGSLMSVIIKSPGRIELGARIACELEVRAGALLHPPAEKSRTLFGIDPAALTAEERRWLRQAVLFALEARDPNLRADRLRALGVR